MSHDEFFEYNKYGEISPSLSILNKEIEFHEEEIKRVNQWKTVDKEPLETKAINKSTEPETTIGDF